MARYRAYLLDEHHRVISVAKFDCADEQAAKERAQQLVQEYDVELWELDRRIAVFEAFSKHHRRNEPPPVDVSRIKN